MTRGQMLAVGFLVAAVVCSGVAVVHAKNASRALFVDLQQVRLQKDHADMEWGRLQLQNTTLATHSNVESRARKDLKMQLPENVELVRLK